MGNAHPSVFPYEPLHTADDDLIVACGNDGQFVKLAAVLGIPDVARTRATPATPTGRRTASSCARCSSRRWRSGAVEWFDLLVAAGVPCGPINTIDGGFAMAERFGLDPVVEVGEGDRAVPTTRHPLRLSATPASYRLPPPELDEHGTELRTWLSGGLEDVRG
jgi:crotonobetainyl-CoA:carnitine CoA-transferase CaiB-like acyl-CoA transferase